MPEKSPSDPADHALDFARRYAMPMDYFASQRMIDLGIPREKIGTSDPAHGIRHAAFHPDYPNAGGVSPDGRIVIEGGLFNPTLLVEQGPEVSEAWASSRLRDRLDAVIAHEHEEYASGSHEGAVERAAESALPIRPAARELLRKIRMGEQRGRSATPSADPSPPQ